MLISILVAARAIQLNHLFPYYHTSIILFCFNIKFKFNNLFFFWNIINITFIWQLTSSQKKLELILNIYLLKNQVIFTLIPSTLTQSSVRFSATYLFWFSKGWRVKGEIAKKLPCFIKLGLFQLTQIDEDINWSPIKIDKTLNWNKTLCWFSIKIITHCSLLLYILDIIDYYLYNENI